MPIAQQCLKKLQQSNSQSCIYNDIQIVHYNRATMNNIFITLISLAIFIYLYFITATYFAHRRFNYLQETSMAVFLGLLVGLTVFLSSDFFETEQEGSQQAIRNIIFLVLLPPIMFEDGYNFPKRKFVQNILYVNLYGLLGTILNFTTVWGLLTLFNQYSLFVSVSDVTEVIVLSNWEILIMSAAFCSIEPIVTEKVVDKQRYPKLFSIMLGESLYKDTISITLFDAINQMVTNSNDPNFDIEGNDVGFLILRFLEVVAGSILIGFVAGIFTTVVFKNLRFLMKEEGISEMALTFLTGYIAYLFSEWLQFSGVISMLFCGTILSHYNVYNMTAIGCETTKVTVEVLKMGAAGIIFFFIGFEMFNIQSFQSEIGDGEKAELSLSLLGFTFLALLIGRTVNVYLISLLGWLIVGREKWKLNVYEYFIIFLTGLIHGAVPFALSVTIPFLTSSPPVPTTNCVQLNIIFVVVISCLFFNPLVPKLIRLMLAKIRQLQMIDRNHPSVKDSFLQNTNNLRVQSKFTIIDDPSAPFFKRLKSTTEKYWKKLENGFLKPHLIFNYHERKNQIKLDKLNKRKEEHDRYLKKFVVGNKENLLNADNEEENMFYEVVYSNRESDSDDEGEDKIIIRKDQDKEKAKQKGKGKGSGDETPKKERETEITTMKVQRRNSQQKKNSKGESEGEGNGRKTDARIKYTMSADFDAPQKHESKGQIILTIEEQHD